MRTAPVPRETICESAANFYFLILTFELHRARCLARPPRETRRKPF